MKSLKDQNGKSFAGKDISPKKKFNVSNQKLIVKHENGPLSISLER